MIQVPQFSISIPLIGGLEIGEICCLPIIGITMKYISTRLDAPTLSFEDVVLQGLATDGGLYVPDFLPKFDDKKLSQMKKMT